jgi:hypothetical protein
MLPLARKEGLHVEELPDELMVYDVERQKAHCLSPAAASVWRSCDGQTTAHQLSLRLRDQGIHADEEMVWMILHRLSKLDLLAQKVTLPENAIFSTRRALMKKVAAAGGMLLLLTATVAAPAAAQAKSGGEHHKHHHPDPPNRWPHDNHGY